MEKGRPFAHMVEVVNARAWLESTKERGMALGLEHTARAIEALGLPAPTYETVHVAGSNGKGTTVAALGERPPSHRLPPSLVHLPASRSRKSGFVLTGDRCRPLSSTQPSLTFTPWPHAPGSP